MMFVTSIAILVTTLYAIGLTLYLLSRFIFLGHYNWQGPLDTFAPWLFLPLVIFLPLALLLHTQWPAVLMGVLSAIGIVWFGSYYLPHRSSKAPEGTLLRVLSFNIWGNNPCQPELAARIREINADVVFLQEVPEGYSRSELPGLLDLYPYQFAPKTEDEWWNSVTLSRYPIVESKDLLFWNLGMPALHKTVIDVNGQHISTYNVHMVVPFTGGKGYGFSARWAKVLYYEDSEQRQKIGMMLDYLRADPNPQIMAGDFNMSCYSAPYGFITEHMTDSFREAGRGFGMTWPVAVADNHFPVQIAAIRIDYIWHSRGLHAVEAHPMPQFGSDHLPVYAKIYIGDK